MCIRAGTRPRIRRPRNSSPTRGGPLRIRSELAALFSRLDGPPRPGPRWASARSFRAINWLRFSEKNGSCRCATPRLHSGGAIMSQGDFEPPKQ